MVMPIGVSASDIGWNSIAGRYVNLTTGRFVSYLDVRNVLDGVLQGAQTDMIASGLQLQSGLISLQEWQAIMRADIKALHTISGAAARGGWAQMSLSDWGYVGSEVKKQYAFLENFVQQIQSGQQALDGRFLTRVQLYAQAGRGTYEQMRRRCEKLYNKMQQERRVLGIADHCNGCLVQAALRWQPIGRLDSIGDEECCTNCRCHFEFRRKEGNKWIYSEAV